jgi:hypothetical protein
MALNKSAHAKGIVPTPVAVGCEVVACRAEFVLSADLAVNDIIEMMQLPAGHVPVDLILDTDDLGTTGAVGVGLLNSGKTDIDTTASGGAAWLTGGDVATAATGLRADAAQRCRQQCEPIGRHQDFDRYHGDFGNHRPDPAVPLRLTAVNQPKRRPCHKLGRRFFKK